MGYFYFVGFGWIFLKLEQLRSKIYCERQQDFYSQQTYLLFEKSHPKCMSYRSWRNTAIFCVKW